MNRHENRQLDFLASRLQILDCIYRIARGVDRLDRALVLSGYHEDALDDHATFVGGPKGFVDYAFELHQDAHKSTAHIICNHVCEIEGDVAHAETYYIFASENTVGPPYSLAGGRYVDRFERRDGRWAIALRKCVVAWNTTPDSPVSQQMAAAFALVGRVSRDPDDLSYERPLAMTTERLARRSGA
jgi:hypothetical protein